MARNAADILIEKLLSDDRLRQKKAFSGGVYRDEPIIKKASAMKSYVPEEIREMRKIIASPYSLRFYKQALAMVNFTDNYNYSGSFNCYYPTYADMSNDQLRGYFTWRAAVRQGEVKKAPPGFAFVYVYEMLMLIGARDEADGYERLRNFFNAYKQADGVLEFYREEWSNDFIVYYDLDRSLFSFHDEGGKYLPAMQHISDITDEELFEAAAELSSYNIKRSRLFTRSPEQVRRAVCAVLRTYDSYYTAHRKNTFFEHLFGRSGCCPYSIFGSAVFYDLRKYEDYEYTVNEALKYKCVNGYWYEEKIHAAGKSKNLGKIMRAVDFIMRRRLEITPQLKETDISKQTAGIIEKELDKIAAADKAQQEKEKHLSAPTIDIDMSRLSEIRRAADITRDRLMTEEDRGNNPEELQIHIPRPENHPKKDNLQENIAGQTAEKIAHENENICGENGSAFDSPTDLTQTERAFIKLLLSGGDAKKFALEKGIMLSVIGETINEKMYDIIGDSPIAFDGDEPYILEDYIDDMKGISEK